MLQKCMKDMETVARKRKQCSREGADSRNECCEDNEVEATVATPEKWARMINFVGESFAIIEKKKNSVL